MSPFNNSPQGDPNPPWAGPPTNNVQPVGEASVPDDLGTASMPAPVQDGESAEVSGAGSTPPPPKRWVLWPDFKQARQANPDKPKFDWWEWVRDWADGLVYAPFCLIAFLLSDKWIRSLDPTAQALSPETLSVLNFNVFLIFLISVIAAPVFRVWVRGKIFPKGWEHELTAYQVMKVKLTMLALILAVITFVITRSV